MGERLMGYTVLPAPIETAYSMGSPYELTNAFETGAEVYDDLEPFVKLAQGLLDDESI